ncbi:hypothetical protein GPOL_c07050 [Gordonia polyisoprenivorans VH2]|uniref:Integrase n=1 Tax=Gordonia polyisoprenivorans (strain DSM 44266 / VH2) TaxID=1112204 RepID=H6MWW8_GORPV|nr:hypothetical protein [Gordonia polyisoprenivorans]AFA71774.1 hypothetical protein GPOL_c07050 [Gordonia polyisoprenivorans VH2]
MWAGPNLPDPSHATLIAPYARWAVLRAARRRATYTSAAANSGRKRTRLAARLLNDLAEQGKTVDHLTQAALDQWTAGNRQRARGINGFVVWLTARGHLSNVTPYHVKPTPPSELGSDNEHFARITELLQEPSPFDLGDRIAGLLILLYGERLSRIRTLTTADVNVDGNTTTLTLGSHPLNLPAPLGTLIRRRATHVHGSARARVLGDAAKSYLYPGGRPHEPIHTTTLGRRLKAIGISPRIHRNHAMFALTSDLPAAVVATQFSLTIDTAWAAHGQRDQSDYLAARTASPGRRPAPRYAPLNIATPQRRRKETPR